MNETNATLLPFAPRVRPTRVTGRVLVIEDEPSVRNILVRLLEREGHECVEAANAHDADALIAREPLDVVLCDPWLPGERGLKAAIGAASAHPEIAIVICSGHDDRGLIDTALELGAYGYVTKPFKHNDVVIGVANALHRRNLEQETREQCERLETLVEERTAELQVAMSRVERTANELDRSREQIVRRLSRAVEYRDEDTGGHVDRMSRYCGLLASRLGLDGETLRVASPMHDVGKIAVTDAVLLKPGKLTSSERAEMERHCDVGYSLLAGSGSPLLELAASIALTHHERVDGTGYPNRLRGDSIPIAGCIAAVADVFDALTNDRVYRPAFEVEQALEMMAEGRGTQFDPVILDTFFDAMDDVLATRARFSDRFLEASSTAGMTGLAEHVCQPAVSS